VIDSVFLFDRERLIAALTSRHIKIGVATSLRKADWEAARVFAPQPDSPLRLTRQSARAVGTALSHPDSAGPPEHPICVRERRRASRDRIAPGCQELAQGNRRIMTMFGAGNRRVRSQAKGARECPSTPYCLPVIACAQMPDGSFWPRVSGVGHALFNSYDDPALSRAFWC
jgi:hypothetical protein